MADLRNQNQSSLDSLFKMDTVRMEFEEDEDDHSLFVTSLARLGAGLQAATAPVDSRVPSIQSGE
jgi:hypothetical protein